MDIRLYVTTTEARAGAILDLMTEVFGEEDFAIATTEIDERKDIWEASVYMTFDDEAQVSERLQALLSAEHGDLSIEREVIPDIDWVSKSLEGLSPVRAGRFLVHGSHDRDKVAVNDIAIEIDAGQAFGRAQCAGSGNRQRRAGDCRAQAQASADSGDRHRSRRHRRRP